MAGGAFDDDFFDDGDVLSNVGGSDDEEALGPLKEGKAKKDAKGKKAGGRKPAGKAGAKRKGGGGGAGAAKKARK